MTIQVRAYTGVDDLNKILAFTARVTALAGDCGYLHVGDIMHRLFNTLRGYDPCDLVRLWEERSGALVAWAFTYPHFGSFEYMVHPSHRGRGLERRIIDLMERRTLAWMEQIDHPGHISIDVFECDKTRSTVLKSQGYGLAAPLFVYTVRSLDTELPVTRLPAGFTIRHAASDAEAGKLAEVHNGAFNTGWTADEYRRVMQSPGYKPERELVVVAPDGRFAAFCIYWLDTVNKTGLFEPVGAHVDFRRRGLTRALMVEAMRQLQWAGMASAIVWHEVENIAARNLYAGLGFVPKHQVYLYEKARPQTEG